MLQVNTRHFASDALEDAMRLAQTKALNSYTFSDCLEHLNYCWSDIYSRVACIDDGYYGTNVRLTKKLTKIPPFIKNSVRVYYAQNPTSGGRVPLRSAGDSDLGASGIYKVSGTDLWCPDAEGRTVWLYFVPACPQIFFTHHNRDPKLYEHGHAVVRNTRFNLFNLKGYDENDEEVDIAAETTDITTVKRWSMVHRGTLAEEDVTELLAAAPMDDDEDGEWLISYISCDYPYIFVTYRHSLTGEHLSGFFDADKSFNVYNPFAFTGRNSDVEYVECHWNDKTGMGVVIKDFNDLDELEEPRIKELGWTPDTRMDYPVPEMYRYLVARLADKLSALNESNVMGVQKELVEAKYAFEAFLDRDKASFKRIVNVNPPTIGDWL